MKANTGVPVSPLLIMGNFGVLCGAFAIVGVLPSVRDEFGLTAFQASMLLSVYALTYALASPVLGWIATRFTYHTILAIAAGTAAAGALVVALADSFGLLVASRAVSAVGAALFTPTAAALAISTSEAGREGRTLALVSLGIPMSQVFGLPLAAWIGDAFGWRVGFYSLVAFLVLVAMLVLLAVPASRRATPMAPSAFLRALGNRNVLLNVCLTLLLSIAVNMIYTFQALIFGDRAGLSTSQIGSALLVMGIGTLCGTWLTGRAVDRLGPSLTLALQGLCVALVVVPMTMLEYGFALACLLGFLGGAAMFSHIPPVQVRLMALVPGNAGVLFSVNASFVYIGTALGSSLSGRIVDAAGLTVLGPVAAGVTGLAVVYLGWLVWRDCRRAAAS